MGAGASCEDKSPIVSENSADDPFSVRFIKVIKKLGTTNKSSGSTPNACLCDDSCLKPVWKSFVNVNDARKGFLKDKSLPINANDSMFELRLVLDEHELLKVFMAYAKDTIWDVAILCWVDIQCFNVLEPEGVERVQCNALNIYEKYITNQLPFLRGGDFDLKREDLGRIFQNLEGNSLPPNIFADLQLHCFLSIYHSIWKRFQTSQEYQDAIAVLKSYNFVGVNDFQYMEKLGEGGYGFVVHAKKWSTGKHYAVKVQTKLGLLDTYQDCPYRVTFERQALTRCNHPFIIGLDYAFCSDDLVFLVTELGRCGTLRDAYKGMAQGKLSGERVRFYTAEIVLGLSHLHRMGFMFRDLKPSNVLLMQNGHIKLVDLGGVLDPKERLLKPSSSTPHQALSFLSEYAEDNINRDSNRSGEIIGADTKSSSIRANSIMGTPGYMAPEVLGMNDENYYLYDVGYSVAVDWWGLGVCMMELLTGVNPFKKVDMKNFAVNLECGPPEEYAEILRIFLNMPDIDQDAKDIIAKFLDIDSATRLGSGPRGMQDIKQDKYFADIDWVKLGQLLVTPPCIPQLKETKAVVFPSFDDMLKDYGTKLLRRFNRLDKDKLSLSIYLDRQFEKWRYVAPKTILLELAGSSSSTDKTVTV